MHRITWNGIALHGGPLPGYAASHGCVRLPFGFAEKLFDKTRIGMRVVISPNDAAPVDFSHAALFVQSVEAIAAAPARAEALAREAAEAAKAADEAKRAAATAEQEITSLSASLRNLKSLKTRADAELASADKAPAVRAKKRTKPRHGPKIEGRRRPPRPRKWRRSSTPLRPTPSPSSTPRPPQRTPPRRQRQKRPSPPKRQSTRNSRCSRSQSISAARRISFTCGDLRVSRCRMAASILTRQFEVPVTIRNPEKRIGTHVFTAIPNDAGLRWTAVTINDANNAKDALDRITIPQDVLNRIAPTAVSRS